VLSSRVPRSAQRGTRVRSVSDTPDRIWMYWYTRPAMAASRESRRSHTQAFERIDIEQAYRRMTARSTIEETSQIRAPGGNQETTTGATDCTACQKPRCDSHCRSVAPCNRSICGQNRMGTHKRRHKDGCLLPDSADSGGIQVFLFVNTSTVVAGAPAGVTPRICRKAIAEKGSAGKR